MKVFLNTCALKYTAETCADRSGLLARDVQTYRIVQEPGNVIVGVLAANSALEDHQDALGFSYS